MPSLAVISAYYDYRLRLWQARLKARTCLTRHRSLVRARQRQNGTTRVPGYAALSVTRSVVVNVGSDNVSTGVVGLHRFSTSSAARTGPRRRDLEKGVSLVTGPRPTRRPMIRGQ